MKLVSHIIIFGSCYRSLEPRALDWGHPQVLVKSKNEILLLNYYFGILIAHHKIGKSRN
jgi:hypothetical protein